VSRRTICARRWRHWATAVVALAATLPIVPQQAAEAAPPAPALILWTMPVVSNAPVLFDGKELRTGPDGRLRIVPGDWTRLRQRMQVPTVWREGRRIRFSRWIGRIDLASAPTTDLKLAAVFNVDYPVRFRFVGPTGKPVPYERISEVELRAATGGVIRVSGKRLREPVLLWGSRVVTLLAGLQQKDIHYRLQTVRIRGANVVNQAQQRYVPATDRSVSVKLLFFDADVMVRDALFGFPVGIAVRVRYPDGTRERYPLGPERTVTLRSLPRGQYEVTVEGLGLPVSSSVALTRPQTIPLKFVTWLDLAAVALAGLTFLVGLPLLGRRMLRQPRTRGRREVGRPLPDPIPRQGP
jgi:hypothetical protein